MTIFEKRSNLTGNLNRMELPITPADVEAWERSGQQVQRYFPQLDATQREFLISGASQEEWDAMFPEEEDDEEPFQEEPEGDDFAADDGPIAGDR